MYSPHDDFLTELKEAYKNMIVNKSIIPLNENTEVRVEYPTDKHPETEELVSTKNTFLNPQSIHKETDKAYIVWTLVPDVDVESGTEVRVPYKDGHHYKVKTKVIAKKYVDDSGKIMPRFVALHPEVMRQTVADRDKTSKEKMRKKTPDFDDKWSRPQTPEEKAAAKKLAQLSPEEFKTYLQNLKKKS